MPPAHDHTLDAEAGAERAYREERREPYLWVLLQGELPLSGGSRHRLGAGGSVTIGRADTKSSERRGDYRATTLDLRIPDRRMSSQHAVIEGALGKWTLKDAGSRNGIRVNGASVTRRELEPGDLIELGHTLLLYDEVLPGDGRDDVDETNLDPPAAELATLLPSLAEDFGKLSRIAPTEVPVLVLGETGTGKEVAARALHELSLRRGKFIGVNSAAIPSSLLESELFGSTRGAFSGSISDRAGLVRAADRGTLFLDEIGDLPLASQAAFLRVLQERSVRPVGGTDSRPVDLRVVSATNQDITRLVRDGRFREDLFGRLAGFRLRLPPLRERRADLGILVSRILRRVAGDRASRITITLDAARALATYDFPLNVRELENWLATAVALSADGVVRAEHFPAPVDLSRASNEPARLPAQRPLSELEEKHKAEVMSLLREHHGNVSAVARAAGKGRTQVQRWLKRYALNPEDFR